MENGEKPMEAYLKMRFKNLSHFPTAFKREYVFPPSKDARAEQAKKKDFTIREQNN